AIFHRDTMTAQQVAPLWCLKATKLETIQIPESPHHTAKYNNVMQSPTEGQLAPHKFHQFTTIFQSI
ncbi:hypothetical protein SFRURICE_012824, partial [Spodoptera frugiperda]